jgi:hypothetical protein
MQQIVAVIGLGLASQASAQTVIFSGGFEPPPGGPATDQDAMRFLTQATFGPTMPEFDHLNTIGINAWLDEQFARPFSGHRPYLDAIAALPRIRRTPAPTTSATTLQRSVFRTRPACRTSCASASHSR